MKGEVIVKSTSLSYDKRYSVKNARLEKTLSGISALVIWIILAIKGSGPIFSDELLYIDIGLNNLQIASYGNRYFHVYLQKLFMSLAPSPLTGVKIFWGFLIALTALLVYWNARSFFKHSNPTHGALAVLFFFSYRFIAEYCGVTSADITAMMMVIILLTIYLYYIRSKRKHQWAVIALGAVVFLSFKTKETTLFANIILFGLLFDDEGRFSLKNILPLIKPFLSGVLAAIGLFILLDTIFLHNPLFFINPQTIAAVFENYAYTGGFRKEPVSYFTTFLLADLMVPFLLFLLSGTKQYDEKDSPALKIVWLFPLVLALFMTLNMLKIPWGFIERFYFPALPVIAILAPQFLNFEWPKITKAKISMAVLLIGGIGLILFLRQSFMTWSISINWEYGLFLDSIFHPVLLCLLLSFILFVRKMNWLNILFPVVCIFALLLAPLMYNQKYIFRNPFTTDIFNQQYAPFITYRDQIHYSQGMKMYFSISIPTEANALSYNRDELSAMFNVYFNGRASRPNFILGLKSDEIAKEITAETFDYVLLSNADWKLVLADFYREKEIQQMYKIYPDPAEQVILLVKK
jgi:hypothetical protein